MLLSEFFRGEISKLFTANLYIKKFIYSKEECVFDVFQIIKFLKINNLIEIKVNLFRYLQWTLIEMIYILTLYLMSRGFYIIKSLLSKNKIKNDEDLKDEKELQKETKLTVNCLYLFLVIIKIIIIFWLNYLNFYDDYEIPILNTNFYKECITDINIMETLEEIHPYIVKLYLNNSILFYCNFIVFSFTYSIRICKAIIKKLFLKYSIKKLKYG